jgi:hypothetical protein
MLSIAEMSIIEREAAINELLEDVRKGAVVPVFSDLKLLDQVLEQEKSDEFLRLAFFELFQVVISQLLTRSSSFCGPNIVGPTPNHVERDQLPDQHLAAWMMEPFCRRSLVFDVCDPSGRVRDEKAVTDLGYYVPERYRSGVKPRTVTMGEFKSATGELSQLDAVAFMGRLGLFAPDTSNKWGMEKPRFEFVSQTRPPDLEAGAVDTERYHRIVAATGPGGQTRHYDTYQEGDERIDYGLIQRYHKRVNAHLYCVLLCAGISAPGSRAAARYIGSLFTDNEETEPIPLPPEYRGTEKDQQRKKRISANLEAIVRVTADRPDGGPVWKIKNFELVEMYLDDYQWYEDERAWGCPTPGQITIVSRAKSMADYVHDSVSEIWLDGQKCRFHTSSAARKQVLSLCRIAHDHKGHVSLDELKADDDVWGHDTRDFERQLTQIRETLFDLKKRRFGRALVDEGQEWKLTAEINYEFMGSQRVVSRVSAPGGSNQKVATPTGEARRRPRSKKRPTR